MLLASQIAVALQSDTVPINADDAMEDISGVATGERNTCETDISDTDMTRSAEQDRVAPAFNEGAHTAAGRGEEHFPALLEEGGYLRNQYFVGYKVRHCIGFESSRFRVVFVSFSSRLRVVFVFDSGKSAI